MVRTISEQSIPELAQRVTDLTARVAELTRRVELSESVRGNGRRDQKTDPIVHYADDESSPIEFLTENGFSIVRPWESEGSPTPTDGKYRFRVSDPLGNECLVDVETSEQLVTETVLHTRGCIQLPTTFWICCAERHLANYVAEHDDFPHGNHLTVESLDCEEVLLAMRWGKSAADEGRYAS